MSTIILLANASSGNENGITFNYPSLSNKATLTFTSLTTDGFANYEKNFLATASINQDNKDNVVLKLPLTADLEYNFSAKDHASLKIIKFRDELEQYLKNNTSEESSIPEIRQICYEIKDFITQIKSLVVLLNTNLALGINLNDLNNKYHVISSEDFFTKSKDQIPLFALIYSKYIPKDQAVIQDKANVKDPLEVGEYPQYLSIQNSWREEILYTVHDESINCLVMDYYSLGQTENLKFTENFFDDLKSIYLSSIIASLARENLSNGGVVPDNGNNNGAMTEQKILELVEKGLLKDETKNDIFLRVSPTFANFTAQNTQDLNGKAPAQQVIEIDEAVLAIKDEMKSFATEATIVDIKSRLTEKNLDGSASDNLLLTINNYAKITYLKDELKDYVNITDLTKAGFLVKSSTEISDVTRNVYTTEQTFCKEETYSKIYIDGLFKSIANELGVLATLEGMETLLEIIKKIKKRIEDAENNITSHDTRILFLEANHVTLVNFNELTASVETNTTAIGTINDSIDKLGDLDDLKKLADFFIKPTQGDPSKTFIDAYTKTQIDQLFYTKAEFTTFKDGEFKNVVDLANTNKRRLDNLPNFSLLPKDLGDITLLVNALVIENPINNAIKLVNVYTKPEADNRFASTGNYLTANDLSGYATVQALNDSKFLTSASLSDEARNIYTKLEVNNLISNNNPTIDTNAVQDLINSTLTTNNYVTQEQLATEKIITVDPTTKVITTNVYTIDEIDKKGFATQSAITTAISNIQIPDFSGITDVNDLAKYSVLESINIVNIRSGVISSNVYPQSDTYSKTDANDRFALKVNCLTTSEIKDWVLTATFTPVSKQVTKNQNDIALLDGRIDTINATLGELNTEQLQSIITLLDGVDVAAFIKRDELVKLQILKKDGANFEKNVYSIDEANTIFAVKGAYLTETDLTTAVNLTKYYLKTETYSQTDANDRFAKKLDLDSIVTAVQNFASNEQTNIESLIGAITSLLDDKQVKNCPVRPQ